MTRQTLLAAAICLAFVPSVQAVEAFDGNIVLGRPTNTSISVNVLSLSDQEVYVEYGSRPRNYETTTPAANLRANEPHVFELSGLEPDAGYSYRWRFRTPDDGKFLGSAPANFRTQRARGSAYTFAVQADSHMGAMTRHHKWCPTCGRELADDVTFANTMINIVKYNPDFLVGGLDNPFGGSRGGHIYAEYFEWGGRTPFDIENWSAPRGPEAAENWEPRPRVDPETESYDFDEHRPDWGVPIHRMLVDNGVNVVFHGHDHVYVKEAHRDGIIYQAVAQPSRKAGGDVISMAEREGYDVENGVIHSSPGFLNVSISPDEATVEYVKTVEDCAVEECSYIADSYMISAE